jgi:hypothetical protein
LVEQPIRNRQVSGSSPLVGSIHLSQCLCVIEAIALECCCEEAFSAPPECLTGWKKIANYLGHSVRTTQRYERIYGLPVRHVAGRNRGPVIATKIELNAWREAMPLRKAFHLALSPMLIEQSTTLVSSLHNSIEQMQKLQDDAFALRNELEISFEKMREYYARRDFFRSHLFQSRQNQSNKPN